MDGIYFRIVGNGFQGYVRHPLVDKPFLDIIFSLVFGRYLSSNFRFLFDAFGRVGKIIMYQLNK